MLRAILLAVTSSACAVEVNTAEAVQPTCSQNRFGTTSCDCNTPLTCQGNTSTVAGTGIWELDASMQAYNARGFKITGMGYLDSVGTDHAIREFSVDGVSVHLTLDDGSSVGAFAIPGLHMDIHYLHGEDYQLRVIPSAITVPFYDHSVSPLMVGYHLEYRPQDGRRWTDLCANKDYTEHGLATVYALISKGDRLDPATGAVTVSGDKVGSWFQISCAEDVWTKVLRTHTGEAVAPSTPPAQRTATSFMFTADYCGNAEHDTVVGTDIDWADKSEGRKIGAVTAESVWTEHGALCLTTPRIQEPVSCARPPVCTADQLDHWYNYGWLKSGTP